ncbi:MAG: hypothetical protein E7345_05170 [Clostridiales bacterium]|nr:hypothetical protein [Clostridiales bacterium]
MLSSNRLLESNLMDSIFSVFEQMGVALGGQQPTKAMQIITLVSLAIFIAGVAICILLISRTYESKLLKCVTGFNKYFKKHPFINEDNLVEVNNKFKRVPKTLRYSWQEYMLNRDRQPSEYINSTSCIDQPTRSSSYKTITNIVLYITIMVSVLAFIGNFACVYPNTITTSSDAVIGTEGYAGSVLMNLFQISLFPLIYLFVGLFVVAFLRLMESSRYADLYYEFHEFERYLNKACSTMPTFVEYEVLFTPKEIREAIPVLQEYLEKRALQEQKMQEEAEMNANHFEKFDFEPVGVESSLLLDRAMLEGEKYFNFKRGMTERINSKETEMFNFQKKFDEVTKDYERKSQAVRENMASITEQLNATSVKIEANYLKKRYNEEQQKQQQLEKDYEYSKINFEKQQQEMEQEIAQLSAEVKEKKIQIEQNMMSECRNYANKVWGEINKTLQEQQEPIIKEKEEKARIMQEEIDKMTLLVADQDADIKAKQEYILKLEQDIKVRLAEIEAINNVRDYFNTPEFKQRVADKKKKRKLGYDEEEYEDTETIEEKKNAIAEMVSTSDREDKLKLEENELLAKLKEVKKADSEYKDEIEEINKRAKRDAEAEANPFAAFTNIQKDIEETNKELLDNKQDLKETVEKVEEKEEVTDTENATEENSSEEQNSETPAETPAEAPAEEPKKRTSLQGLLDSARKMKK